MARAIDADALKEKYADELSVQRVFGYDAGFVAGIRAALEMPTLTPPNEPLICDGCLWAEMGAREKCSSCMRDKKDNYYRRPPEGDEDA